MNCFDFICFLAPTIHKITLYSGDLETSKGGAVIIACMCVYMLWALPKTNISILTQSPLITKSKKKKRKKEKNKANWTFLHCYEFHALLHVRLSGVIIVC